MPRTRGRRAASNGLEEEDKQPEDPAAKQKMRVYNTSLLSELLQEAEKARMQQAEVSCNNCLQSDSTATSCLRSTGCNNSLQTV